MDDIDAYDEIRAVMRSLERRGVPVPEIIDCGFRLSIGAATRFFGEEATVASLHDMIGLVTSSPAPISRRFH
jgi:hypothetical protein